MRATVVGAGSTYTPELAAGLLSRRSELGLTELVLLDPDERRLAVLAGFVRRMVDRAGGQIEVVATTDLADGVTGATVVFSQFRVGGQAARDGDEQLGRRWGIVGQETTGIGGFAKGLRTVLVALEVQRAVAAHAAPDAWLVNFTNPAGMVTEALLTHGATSSGAGPRVVGLCNFPWVLTHRLATGLGVGVDALSIDYVGLNHLAWVRDVRVGDDARLAAALGVWRAGPDNPFTSTAADDLRMLLNPYLQYYYETGRVLEAQRQSPSRASVVAAVETELLRLYADPEVVWEPSMLAGRGGASYSEAAASLAADLLSGAGESTHIVNVRNGGAIPGLPDDAVVETTCRVGRDGARPVATSALQAPLRGLVSQVKDYERLTIEAAMTGDRRAARLAVLAHPLCPDAGSCDALVDDVLAVNRPWLPAFG